MILTLERSHRQSPRCMQIAPYPRPCDLPMWMLPLIDRYLLAPALLSTWLFSIETEIVERLGFGVERSSASKDIASQISIPYLAVIPNTQSLHIRRPKLARDRILVEAAQLSQNPCRKCRHPKEASLCVYGHDSQRLVFVSAPVAYFNDRRAV